MIYIASDHGGFELKERLVAHLQGAGLEFEDLGPKTYNLADDYPKFAAKVAEKISQAAGNRAGSAAVDGTEAGVKFAGADVGVGDGDGANGGAVVGADVDADVGANAAKGILLCRSGQGMCISANKFKGVRAGVCWNAEVAAAAKRDDDVNVLCLPSEYVSPEEAVRIFDAWNSAQFSPEPRFSRRLEEISELEK